MPKPDYKILLVDDDRHYSQNLVERAFDDHCIELIHYADWESAFTQLKGNQDKFQAVILDAKGKLTQDDSSESMSHIITALQDMKELEGHGIILPYIINTGYFDDSVIGLIKGVKVFAKGNEDKMFIYLIDQIKCSPYTRLKKMNEQILSLFDDIILPVNSGRKLMDVLVYAENPAWTKATGDFFTPLRKILEGVFWKLKEMKQIDDRCFPKNEINLKGCINYISGYTVKIGLKEFTGPNIVPAHINYSMNYLYEMSSTFSHQYLQENEISHYSLQSVALALCEVLYWFNDYIIIHNNKSNTK